MGKHGAKIGKSAVAIALRETMDDTGYNQTSLDEKSGVAQSSISQILSADDGDPMSNPSLTLIHKLEKALGRPLDLDRKEAARMKKDLAAFLETESGERQHVTVKEQRELERRRFFRVDEHPTEQVWVDFIRTCRGLPNWAELVAEDRSGQ